MLERRAPRSAALGIVAVCALLPGCSATGDDARAVATPPSSAVSSPAPADPPSSANPVGPDAIAPSSAAAASTPSALASFTPRRSDLAAVAGMLARRADAVMARDRAAFLATVDDRDRALVAQQRRLFDNLSRLRLTRFSYETADGVLTPDPVRGLEDGDAVLRVATVEHAQLTDVLTAPLGNPSRMTYVRHDGAWLVGRETRPPSSGGVVAQPRPWFGGRVSVAERGPLLVLADAADGDLVDRLARVVEAQMSTDARLLGVEPQRALLVDATSNGRGVRLNTLDDQEAAALYSDVWDVDVQGRPRVRAGGAVRVNPGLSAARLTEDPGLVRHELTHVLLREHAATAPLWASEGIAEYARWSPLGLADLQVPPAMWRRLSDSPRELPTTGLFQLDPSVNYLLAQGAVQSLVERGGTARFLDLLERYRVEAAGEGPGRDALTERLLREVYGIGTAELEREMWQAVARLDH